MVPIGQKRVEFHRLAHLRHGENAALLSGLQRVDLEFCSADAVVLRVLRDDGLDHACAHLHCFFNEIIEPSNFQWREEEVQIGERGLRTFLRHADKVQLSLAVKREFCPPLAIPAVEDQNLIALLQAQDIGEVVELRRIDVRRRALSQWSVDKQPL